MAHPPVQLKPLSWRTRLARKLTGHDQKVQALNQQGRELAQSQRTPTAASTNEAAHWGVEDSARSKDVEWDRHVPKVSEAVVSDALVKSAQLALAEDTKVLVPIAQVCAFLTGSLGHQLMDQGVVSAASRHDLRDALGRHLVNQEWPSPGDTARLKGYAVGIRLAARKAGFEMMD